MECRDPGGWGDSTAAPVRTTGFGGAARVLSAHDAVANDVDSSLGCTAPNRKCSHFSWVRGHLALAGATSAGHPIRTRLRVPLARMVRGPLARMVRCAVGSHRLAHQHAIGGLGLEPAPTVQ